MKLSDLYEARRNPHLNSKRADTFDELAPYYTSGYFISFTALPKLGINPKTKFGTPIGVYAYPLDDDTITQNLYYKFIPYAGNEKYVNLFYVDPDTILDLRKTDDYSSLMPKAVDYYFTKLGHKIAPDQREKIRGFLLGDLADYAADSALVKTDAGMFWNYTRLLANIMKESNRSKTISFSDMERDLHLVSDKSHNNISGWSNIFRHMGYSGVVDDLGIIHRNEPAQAVFFEPREIHMIHRFDNELHDRTIIVKDLKTIRTALETLARDMRSIPQIVSFIQTIIRGNYGQFGYSRVIEISMASIRRLPKVEVAKTILLFLKQHPDIYDTYQYAFASVVLKYGLHITAIGKLDPEQEEMVRYLIRNLKLPKEKLIADIKLSNINISHDIVNYFIDKYLSD